MLLGKKANQISGNGLHWQNQKVFTTEQLINFFGLPADELNQIFSDNRASFIKDQNYFKLINEDARQFKALLEKEDKLLHSTFIFLFTDSGVKKLIAFNPKNVDVESMNKFNSYEHFTRTIFFHKKQCIKKGIAIESTISSQQMKQIYSELNEDQFITDLYNDNGLFIKENVAKWIQGANKQ